MHNVIVELIKINLIGSYVHEIMKHTYNLIIIDAQNSNISLYPRSKPVCDM